MEKENAVNAARVLEYIRSIALRPQKYREICRGLKLDSLQMGQLNQVLGQMEKQGDLIRTRRDQYGLPEMMNIYRGILRLSTRGFGVVTPEKDATRTGEIIVLGRDLNGGMHEDRVLVRLTRFGQGPRRAEGEIVRILTRANRELVGTYQKLQQLGQVIPDDPRQLYPVIVRGGKLKARQGDKVLVEITAWPGKHSDPEGQIVEIFGCSGEAGSDERLVIRKHGLRDVFPLPVLEEARKEEARGTGKLYAYRRDLRQELLITIDGEDTKDVDDAISLTRSGNGWQLGVHIADVSHYVRPGTELDREAYERGTSVYLLDTVLPMLPKALSNGICSLNTGEDRLAITCSMQLDENGRLTAYELYHSLIRVRAGMTYTEVNALLEDTAPALSEQYREIVPMLKDMQSLSRILRMRRKNRGALDFDFPEAGVRLDAEGNPLEIIVKERRNAEKLIEDFMIQANEVVAEHLYRRQAPVLYRVHEKPGAEGLTRLKDTLTVFNCPLPREQQSPKAWQSVLEEIKGEPYAETVAMLLLRALKHADYRPEELGHFGLAAEYYCHFTSPIRRYPDLIVHRTLSYFLRKAWTKEQRGRLESHMAEWGEHCSLQERRAEEAERELLDRKKIRYMKAFTGEVFTGRISGVESFGFFVQLENTVEGLVHISSLEDDYYQYEADRLTLTGARSGQSYRIGDAVEVQLVRAVENELQIDFELYRQKQKPAARKQASEENRSSRKIKLKEKKKGKHKHHE